MMFMNAKKELKPKKCKSCGVMFKPFSSLAKVCSMTCSLDYVDSQKAVKAKKEHVAQKREFLAGDKSFQRAKAQKAVNEFIRLRDANFPCVSCDKPSDWGGQWHAGHYKTTSARPDLRFNEDNINKQCAQCNTFLSGNLAMYRITLVIRIGLDRVLALEIDTDKPNKYTADDYAEITKTYQSKIKELKK